MIEDEGERLPSYDEIIVQDGSTKEFAGMTILKNKKVQFTNITKTLCNSKICFSDEDNNGCGAIQPTKYVKDGISKINAEFKIGSSPLFWVGRGSKRAGRVLAP